MILMEEFKMGNSTKSLSFNPTRDKFLEVISEVLKEVAEEVISKYFPLADIEKLVVAAPKVVLKRLEWVYHNSDECWEALLNLNFAENDLILLKYIVRNRDKNKSWWLESTSDSLLNGDSPPANLSRNELFFLMTKGGRLGNMLYQLDPCYRITFEGPELSMVLSKGFRK